MLLVAQHVDVRARGVRHERHADRGSCAAREDQKVAVVVDPLLGEGVWWRHGDVGLDGHGAAGASVEGRAGDCGEASSGGGHFESWFGGKG